MEIRTAASPEEVRGYTTKKLREEFLIPSLFAEGECRMVYSHIDRVITGAVVPTAVPISLSAGKEIRADSFLQRRELGIINIGGKGSVVVDGKCYEIGNKEGMYIGMGAKEVVFQSDDKEEPARFYLNSAPAHASYPTVRIVLEGTEDKDTVVIQDRNRVELGSLEQSNHRTICKYILPGQVKSCQLVMGMTRLEPGSVWNTMPSHTHDRRMEVYLYFDMDPDTLVMHYMGEPSETRHLVVRNEEAVLSPSWSIHSGCGTKAYTFIWGMAGENQDFDDMDPVKMQDLY